MLKKIPQSEWHPSQRGYFAGCLHNEMLKNKDVILVVGDLGYGAFDRIRNDFPAQFYNVGASEQAGLGICIGLALKGKIPIFYSITTFLLYRGFETIRNYINHEKIPVKLAGSGRDFDYAHDGFSHHSKDAIKVMQCFPNIQLYFPNSKKEVKGCVNRFIYDKLPGFISLRR